MSDTTKWDFGDLEGYIRQGEPERAERAENWQTAIGLQAVDGLTTSPYLLETAKEHIEGKIGIAQAQSRIRSYYEQHAERKEREDYQEADIASSRIAEILGEKSFTFSPVQLQTIHRRLFAQILPSAGTFRTFDITKKEWVLNGETVYYASSSSISDTLTYDFSQERDFEYVGLSDVEVARHIAQFISNIWQVHPFAEGNTRTTAVFAIKYLRAMGYHVENEPFKAHSWYFRNALVRANYENVKQGISPTTTFLELFFQNLLCGGQHELKNRYVHLDWRGEEAGREVNRNSKIADQVTVIDQVTDQVTDQVEVLLRVLGDQELSAIELMAALGLSHRHTFRQNYLNPALAAGLIERTVPDKPTSRLQKYRRVQR